jgi:ribosomal protein L11 methyltransferase
MPMWMITVHCHGSIGHRASACLQRRCAAVLEAADGGVTQVVQGIGENSVDRRDLEVELALAAAAAGVPVPTITIERLAERDWLAENRERFAAFRIGGFRIREPDDRTPCPAGLIDLPIEAATAFGSGRHGSTEGCLRALSALAPQPVRRAIDVGCGSGILAIAAAKLWRMPVLACDVDPAAVAVARANADLNGVGPLVRVVRADGWRSSAITAAAPFDLVLCNILARPLKRMALHLARHIARGGCAVLSGLLREDEAGVLAAHRTVGLRLLSRIDVEAWRTLLVRRPPGG